MSALMGNSLRPLLILTIVLTIIQHIHGSPNNGLDIPGNLNLRVKRSEEKGDEDGEDAQGSEDAKGGEEAQDGEDAEDDEDAQEEFKKLEDQFQETVKKVKESGVNWDDLKPKDHKKVDDMLKQTADSSKKSLDNPVEKHGADEDDDGNKDDGGDDEEKKDEGGDGEGKKEEGGDE